MFTKLHRQKDKYCLQERTGFPANPEFATKVEPPYNAMTSAANIAL